MTDAPHLPGMGPDDAPVSEPPAPLFRVELIRSKRRRKTVGARLVGDVLRVTVPGWMSAAEANRWADRMIARFERSVSAERFDLAARARTLARRHDLPLPATISWSEVMRGRWGSCTIDTAAIRLSNRLAAFPDWVVDYVIVHELAHLRVPAHSAEFWQLVYRYPKAERAIGYLIAKSADGEGEEVD